MYKAQPKSGISANLLIGVMTTAWSAIISIVAIRWYIQLLGIESYGLIGFFATLQAAIGLLDLGLGATINREVARGVALRDLDRVNRLVHSMQLIYGGMALLIGVATFGAAPVIARQWLGTSTLDHEIVEWSVRLMGVVVAVRWPMGLFQGTLIGLQHARAAYLINALMATAANVGAIGLLYLLSRSLWTYFGWQVACALIGLAWMRRAAWRELGASVVRRFDPALLRTLILQSVVVSSMVMSGLLLMQVDKLIVSGSVSLADFGRYSIASTMASVLAIVLIPTFNVIYPRMSGLVAADDTAELNRFYRLGSRLLLCGLIPIALSAVFYAEDLLQVWTGDAHLALTTAPIVRLLVVGAALNGVMNFPYAMQMATSNERLALYTHLMLIVLTVPVTFLLAQAYGMQGGAIGWLLQQTAYFCIGVTITDRFILRGQAMRWLFSDLLPPVGVGTAAIAAGHQLAMLATDNPLLRLLVAGGLGITTAALLLSIRADTRNAVGQIVPGRNPSATG